MQIARPLESEQLRWICDPQQFSFQTTAELENIEGLLGQARAEEAIEFGIGMNLEGYNLYVLGPPGSGKRTVIRNYLKKRAESKDSPLDWCYVNNFDSIDRPTAIQLPAGKGSEFEDDVLKLVDDLQSAIPAALDAEDHRQKIEQNQQKLNQEHEDSLENLAETARKSGLEMIRTPTGIALAPVKDGQVISPDEFQQLPDEKRAAIEKAVEAATMLVV